MYKSGVGFISFCRFLIFFSPDFDDSRMEPTTARMHPVDVALWRASRLPRRQRWGRLRHPTAQKGKLQVTVARLGLLFTVWGQRPMDLGSNYLSCSCFRHFVNLLLGYTSGLKPWPALAFIFNENTRRRGRSIPKLHNVLRVGRKLTKHQFVVYLSWRIISFLSGPKPCLFLLISRCFIEKYFNIKSVIISRIRTEIIGVEGNPLTTRPPSWPSWNTLSCPV